jgi:tetratricopeptide (TPR) repeat protein
LRSLRQRIGSALWIVATLVAPAGLATASDDGVIRLRPAPQSLPEMADSPASLPDPRRGFDYDAFESRLQALWFQRKTLLGDGRDADVAQQSQLIRSFCTEEGVRRLENLSGALVVEAHRFLEQGHHDRAWASLDLAETFDPDRPQLHLARATALCRFQGNKLAAAGELFAALRSALVRSVQDLSLFNQLAPVLVVALVGCLIPFSLLMVIRYNLPFRHELEEWAGQALGENWGGPLGWAVLFLPMVVWFAAGWIVLYWILITFRFMRHGERLVAVLLLAGASLAVPAYRLGVSLYALTADPLVRTTLASATGEYDPDRIVELRRLVDSHPNDPVYRFLLAGLYKNGRYFEEAFDQYKQALELNSTLVPAHVNVGNIFYATGQYPEASAHYREALTLEPGSTLALFNLHLAQSEAFRFKEAEATLRQARAIDSRRTAELFAEARERSERPTVLDATLHMSSVWQAALAGGGQSRAMVAAGSSLKPGQLVRQLGNPLSIACLLTLAGCGLMLALSGRRAPARRCVRCGRAYCRHCKSNSGGQEYCTQCHHLFVVGEGLDPRTKHRKLYELERWTRRRNIRRTLVSLVFPGAGQMLHGRALTGALLLLGWLAALIAWQPTVLLPLTWLTGVEPGFELMRPRNVPALYGLNPFSLLALMAMLLIWTAGNAWRLRRKGA